MGEHVTFHFDPICPWCYQTSRWIRRLGELGEVTVSWALFSLELVNEGNETTRGKRHDRSAPGLRTAVAVRDAAGEEAVGEFYATLGARIHERGEDAEDAATVQGALRDAGRDADLYDRAMKDDGTWATVRAEHERLVRSTRSFGVPTIVLDGGGGPAIFGPVISEVPSDEDAVELWRHVSWLARYANFSELKRDRTTKPDLASVRA